MPEDIDLPSPPLPPAESALDEWLDILRVDTERSPSFTRHIQGHWTADYETAEPGFVPVPMAIDTALPSWVPVLMPQLPTSPAFGEDVVVDDASDEDVVSTCPTCNEPETECRCYHCEACEESVDPENSSQCETCENCSDCCACFFCHGCDRNRRTSDQCSNCEQCEGCCDCFYCEGCSENRNDSRCGNCEECEDCCSCVICSSCSDYHNSDYHCNICDRGTGDSCECCPGYDDDEEHRPFEPSARQRRSAVDTGTICAGTCGQKLASYTYCKLCMKCKPCCAAEDSKCHGINRGQQVVQFKDRAMRWHDNTAKTAFLKSRIAVTKDGSRIEPANRHISVELEIDGPRDKSKGRRLHEALEKWGDSVVEDGSVHHGWEINVTPSSGDAFKTHIRELCDGFDEMGFSLSDECGMHVHVNTKDMGFQDLRRLVKLYTKVERAIYDACKPSRLHNSYSVPCGKWFTEKMTSRNPRDFKGDIHTMLYGFDNRKKPANRGMTSEQDRQMNDAYNYVQSGNPYRANVWSGVLDVAIRVFEEQRYTGMSKDAQYALVRSLVPKEKIQHDGARKLIDAKSKKRNNLRYKSLNLHSFFYRGSVEFRHHEGSVDYDVITGFGRLCAEVVSKAVAMSDAQLDALPKNPRKAMLEILPADLKEFIIGEWKKHDTVLNEHRSLKRDRDCVWQLGDYAPIV